MWFVESHVRRLDSREIQQLRESAPLDLTGDEKDSDGVNGKGLLRERHGDPLRLRFCDESDSFDFRKSGTRYLIQTGVSMRRESNVYSK